MTQSTGHSPPLPARLRPGWRQTFAAGRLLTRRLGRPLTPLTWPVVYALWAVPLLSARVRGGLLVCDGATVALAGFRPARRRRLTAAAGCAVVTAAVAGLLAVVALPPLAVAAATFALGGPWPLALAVASLLAGALLLIELARCAPAFVQVWRAGRTVRRLRGRGGDWYRAGLLAGPEGRPEALGRLRRHFLAWADEHGVGLVAFATGPRTARVYASVGFAPDAHRPTVLVRPASVPARGARERTG
ncbi:hypothetical protein [Streptomyces cacaoi]|uniref:hypothetical protein n=1 Tax=Streptomyces cacaoi TaxID=1898 RepID=UPI00374975E8